MTRDFFDELTESPPYTGALELMFFLLFLLESRTSFKCIAVVKSRISFTGLELFRLSLKKVVFCFPNAGVSTYFFFVGLPRFDAYALSLLLTPGETMSSNSWAFADFLL